jgi:hypothetical protein
MPNVIFVVTADQHKAYELLNEWKALGVPGATLLDSIGLHEARQRIGRDDLPLFPSLRNLLAQESPQRTLFAVVGDEIDIEQLIAVSERVVGGFDKPNSGILFVVPVSHVRGLRHW